MRLACCLDNVLESPSPSSVVVEPCQIAHSNEFVGFLVFQDGNESPNSPTCNLKCGIVVFSGGVGGGLDFGCLHTAPSWSENKQEWVERWEQVFLGFMCVSLSPLPLASGFFGMGARCWWTGNG